MKKTKFGKLVYLTALILCQSCSLFGGESGDTSLELTSYGNFIRWNEISKAEKYLIYENGECVSTITDSLTYESENRTEDIEIYVEAIANEKRLKKSNKITLYKNTNFNESTEVLTLDGTIKYTDLIGKSSSQIDCIKVKKNIRKIVLASNFNSIYGANIDIKILNRSADLNIEIESAVLKCSIYDENLNYDYTTNPYVTIFNIKGDCSITGPNGSNGKSISETNTEKKGEDGSNGENGLLLPSITISGDGNLNITGGNGGNGGNGSSTTTRASAKPGKGSNGGNGGAGVLATYLSANMEVSSLVQIADGKGGTKGNPGDNGSLLTGPACTVVWSSVYDVGKSGTVGESSFTKNIKSGKIYYDIKES